MKKLLILFVMLTLVAGIAFAQVTVGISGTSTLKWRIKGLVMEDKPGVITKFLLTPSTDDSGEHEFMPVEFVLKLDVQDAKKLSIVKAESIFNVRDYESIQIPATGTTKLTTSQGPVLNFTENWYTDAFHFIEFPNVIPGMLGILLHKSDSLGTDVSKSGSLAAPYVLATIVPIKDATVKVGVAYEQMTLLEKADNTTPIPDFTTEVGSALNFATSLFGSYKLMIGEKDSVTISIGGIYDTKFFGIKAVTAKTVGTTVWTKEEWKAYVVKDNPAVVIAPVVTEETWGFTTIPFGATVGVALGDLTANVKLQGRLAQGKDSKDIDTSGTPRAYAMPLYAKVDAAYKLTVDNMVITPSVNFQYCSDFWKWGLNAPTDIFDKVLASDAFEYKGKVTAAQFLGRPMSLGVDVAATNIANMVDATLSVAAGLGDGEYDHMNGAFSTVSTLQKYIDDQKTANADLVVADPLVYSLGLTVTAKPIANLRLINALTYTHDGLGIVGADALTYLGTSLGWFQFGAYFNRLKDVVTAEYDLVVEKVVGATFYGIFTFTSDTYPVTKWQTMVVDYAGGTQTAKENASRTKLEYEVGVKVTVKL